MRRMSKILEVGDDEFPLTINLDTDIDRDHKWVGTKAIVTDLANEVMSGMRGKEVAVIGVIIKNDQVAGLEVYFPEDGKTYYAPRKDFKVGKKNILEDIYLDSIQSQEIKRVLNNWSVQRDYYGTYWEGVEAFNFNLAVTTSRVGVESAGWYKYPSSTREDMDGKDWRLLVPAIEEDTAVSVNCHSLLHDSVWTLSTTIYSTNDVDMERVYLIGDNDHWKRSIIWTIAVAKVLQASGYEYNNIIEELEERLKKVDFLHKLLEKYKKKSEFVYKNLFNSEPNTPEEITIALNDWNLKADKVGAFRDPDEEIGWGILTISPSALDDMEYVEEIIKHEMIHAVIGEREEESHGEVFQEMAEELSLPQEYRD